ncbi:MAG: glycine--tRNA ligase [Thermoplasmatota archaeon]
MAADIGEAVLDLAKRRGFLWPSFEPYGGAAGFYDYGPLGAVMKRRLEELWREYFITREATPMAEIFCPRVTISEVLVASGHVAEFSDFVVLCPKGHPSRADHLVAAPNAAAMAATELDAAIKASGATCPVCGQAGFSPAARQNLMNQTEIGPGSGRVGYLRPETAQGIFTDYPLLLRHFRDRLPFGAVQLGGSNRNEISPRQGMLRLREFSMMEAEVFHDPGEKRHPHFPRVAGLKANLVPRTGEARTMTFGEAVSSGQIANEALAYWMARAQAFLLAAGMDPARLRLRQHLTTEMAHYAADCWDAEFQSARYGWVECVGIADRGSFDLEQHALHSGSMAKHPVTGAPLRRRNSDYLRWILSRPTTFTATDWVPNPRFNPTLKGRAKAAEWILAQTGPYRREAARHQVTADHWLWREDDWLLTERVVETKPASQPLHLELDGTVVDVPAECYDVVTKEVTVQGARRLPHVIEPSFGVDRILYALWEHAYEAGTKNGEPYVRLRLSPDVAPVQVAILPLTNKDGIPERAAEVEWQLREAGFVTDYDASGSIGRRYARQDEVGTPLCVTIDTETATDASVTIRERDSTAQSRAPITDLPAALGRALQNGRR